MNYYLKEAAKDSQFHDACCVAVSLTYDIDVLRQENDKLKTEVEILNDLMEKDI